MSSEAVRAALANERQWPNQRKFEARTNDALDALLAELEETHTGYLREIDAIAERYEQWLAAARAREQRLALALAFYAVAENWQPRFHVDGSSEPSSDVEADGGMHARAALAAEPAADNRTDSTGTQVFKRGKLVSGPGFASAAADEPGEQP